MKLRVLSSLKTVALALSVSLAGHSMAATQVQSEILAEGLTHPWSMAFLPDGTMVITERSGGIRRYSESDGLSAPLNGVPDVVAQNQGGMLGIAVDPEFSKNNTLYFCFSRAGEGGSSSSVAKAELTNTGLKDVEVIFVSTPLVDNGFHFGCRLGFDQQQHLYVTLGDRYKYMKEAQNTDNHFGKIVRINKDGSAVASNPFVKGKAPEVFTYGHRNVQGLAMHPETGEMWAMEHGPKGGDEVNLLASGNNYGWPVITYGIDYNGDIISDKTAQAGMEQPVLYWDPSIAPSGMAFYSGDKFPEWQGDLLVGSLKFRHLRHVKMNDGKPGKQTELLKGLESRVRDVKVGPDGYVYILTDAPNGKLVRVKPQ